MSATSLKPVIEKLESLFSSFNQKFYNGELQTPVITVSPDTTKGAYGWCTSWKAWSNLDPDGKTTDISQMSKADLDAMQNEGFYEINICAEHLARPFEQVAETLLHEMVHLYNLQIGVQDTSRNGTYHNKKFKEAAEQHGLDVGKDPKYGWTITTLDAEARAFVDSLQDKKFELHRKHLPKIPGLCKVASRDTILNEKGASLTPGAYVGVAPVEDDGVDFAQRMKEIHKELLELQAESNRLMETISKNLEEMGV